MPWAVHAQSADPAVDVDKIEPHTVPDDSNVSSNPDVHTRRDQQGTEFREYRVRGQLQAVKVTPVRGPSYWLLQREGVMRRYESGTPNVQVPSWLVLEW
jgi:hypothetical protein